MENELPKRKPNRLRKFDYSSNGAYFVTICIQHRKCILGTIVGDGFPVPKLTVYGEIVDDLINEISLKYDGVCVDKYVIMPNHIHMLLTISCDSGTGNPSPTISKVMGWLKYTATKQINMVCHVSGRSIFQRSFYDHIIRNENDYNEIWQYIENNPAKWQKDKFYIGD